MEKLSTSRDRGKLGLINVKERIQAIQALEYLQANQQLPETDNVLFEVGLHQKTLYGTVVVKGANAPQTKELINLLLKDINKINQYTATHKIVKPKNIQDILLAKNKINYFTEIYIPLEPKHMRGWLSTFNINNFNRETIIKMKNIKDLPDFFHPMYLLGLS